MSSLTLIIGRATASRQSPPFPVYIGESGSAANAAMDRSAAATFEIFRSVHGLRKNNPHAAANAARLAAEGQAAHESAVEMVAELNRVTEARVKLQQEVEQLTADLGRASGLRADLETQLLVVRRNADAQAATIAGLSAEVEQLKAAAAASAPPTKKTKG